MTWEEYLVKIEGWWVGQSMHVTRLLAHDRAQARILKLRKARRFSTPGGEADISYVCELAEVEAALAAIEKEVE